MNRLIIAWLIIIIICFINSKAKDEEIITAHRLVNVETMSFNKDVSEYRLKYKNFMYAPRSHFVYQTAFYLTFLSLFSFLMLSRFKYYTEIDGKSKLKQWNNLKKFL